MQLHGREGSGELGSTRASTDDEPAPAAEGDKQPWAELTSPPLRQQLVLGLHSLHVNCRVFKWMHTCAATWLLRRG